MSLDPKISYIRKFASDQLEKVILPFWLKTMPDELHGGFYGRISHNGTAEPDSPKGLILNARILWSFSAVYAKYKNPEHLKIAQRALDYLKSFFKDNLYPGYFWSLNPDGSMLNGKKQIYAQAFVMYALGEYSAATGSHRELEEALDIYHIIEKYALDHVSGGYFEAFSREWEEIDDLRLSKLDMNEKKTMNTHLHVIEAYSRLYRLVPDKDLGNSIRDLLIIFQEKFIDPGTHHLRLFFDEDWHLKSSAISYGHDIEAAWLLEEAAKTVNDRNLRAYFKDISVKIAEAVIPAVNERGGLIHEYDPEANNTNELEWWAQAEAIVGFYNAYHHTKAVKYLDITAGLANFIDEYFIDRQNGEWFYRIDENGLPLDRYEKAGFWKCPYHTVRMCLKIV